MWVDAGRMQQAAAVDDHAIELRGNQAQQSELRIGVVEVAGRWLSGIQFRVVGVKVMLANGFSDLLQTGSVMSVKAGTAVALIA